MDTTNQMNTMEDLLVKPVAVESLLYLTPSQIKGKFLYLLKH